MVQPSAVSVTSFARKQMASFSLWHILINVACALLCVITHMLFGVKVAAYLAGLLKISFCEAAWRILLRVSWVVGFQEMGKKQVVFGETTVSLCRVHAVGKLANSPCCCRSSCFCSCRCGFPAPPPPLILIPP